MRTLCSDIGPQTKLRFAWPQFIFYLAHRTPSVFACRALVAGWTACVARKSAQSVWWNRAVPEAGAPLPAWPASPPGGCTSTSLRHTVRVEEGKQTHIVVLGA